jgi:hypothetical protein
MKTKNLFLVFISAQANLQVKRSGRSQNELCLVSVQTNIAKRYVAELK